MSERLRHIRDLLAQGDSLPPDSTGWLVRACDRLLQGDEDPRAILELDAAHRRAERDKLLRQAAAELPGSTWGKAKVIYDQAKRQQSGRRAAPLITQAAKAAPLPSTPQRIRQILVQN